MTHPQVQAPNRTIYVAAEPEPVTMWEDTTGIRHIDREAAIEANFEHDLQQRAFASAVMRIDSPLPDSAELSAFLRHFVQHNRDMVRVLLGDRDAT